MNEVLGKLADLTYEFFGVLLPGIIATLFLAIWWASLGFLGPYVTGGLVPRLTVAEILRFLSTGLNVGTAIVLLTFSYFAGHLVLWKSRSGGKLNEADAKKDWKRIARCLRFDIPKPSASYDPSLEPLFTRIQGKFAKEGGVLDWRQFYPVAKSFIAQNARHSLVATYQNKYTLHRSFVTIAAFLAWLNLLSLVTGGIAYRIAGVGPRWCMLGILLVGSLCLIWGFSGSYLYHWQMFGNTTITESYALAFGPKVETTQAE